LHNSNNAGKVRERERAAAVSEDTPHPTQLVNVERQDLSCTCLAHHELESVLLIVIILNTADYAGRTSSCTAHNNNNNSNMMIIILLLLTIITIILILLIILIEQRARAVRCGRLEWFL